MEPSEPKPRKKRKRRRRRQDEERIATKRRRQLAFLAVYSQIGNLTVACREALPKPVPRGTVRRWLTSSDEWFIAEYNEATEQAAEYLEAEARRRAVEGWDEPVTFKGEQAWCRDPTKPGNPLVLDANGRPIPLVVRKFDSTMLIFLIKGAKPEKYRERFEHGVDPRAASTLANLMRRASIAETQIAEQSAKALATGGADAAASPDAHQTPDRE